MATKSTILNTKTLHNPYWLLCPSSPITHISCHLSGMIWMNENLYRQITPSLFFFFRFGLMQLHRSSSLWVQALVFSWPLPATIPFITTATSTPGSHLSCCHFLLFALRFCYHKLKSLKCELYSHCISRIFLHVFLCRFDVGLILSITLWCITLPALFRL